MDGITTHNPIMDVPELIPIDDYDPRKAQLQASIRWLLTKAFGNNLPDDLRSPFYEDEQGYVHLKPTVINGLTSADLYCRACSAIFRDSTIQWEGHWTVMQALSWRGIYVVDTSESAVTETVLLQTQPFKVNAHLAMITSLMQAHAVNVITIERITQAVRRFTTFNASSELPSNMEDAVCFWMNKIAGTVLHRAHRDLEESEDMDIPVVQDIMKDVNDGCCLATIISFYCPEILPLTEVAVKGNLGIADSLYNIQLVCDFCEKHLPGALILTINDLFYTHALLRMCVLAFIAELFYKFEVVRPSFVRDTTKPYTITQASPTNRRGLSGKPPISNATKRSFQNSLLPGDLRMMTSASNPDLHNNSIPPPRQPLLPKRLGSRNNPQPDADQPPRRVVTTLGSFRRSRSLTSVEERDGMRESVRAWEDQEQRRREQDNTEGLSHSKDSDQSTLLANVSIDSDMSLDLNMDSSIDINELDDTPRGQGHPQRGPSAPVGPVSRSRNNAQAHVGNPRPQTGAPNPNPHPRSHHADDMKIENVSSRATSAGSTRNPTLSGRSAGNPHGGGARNTHNPAGNPHGQAPFEPLMPAKLKPAKEKNANHTKEVESGERADKKSPSSPSKPRTLSLKPFGGGDSDSSTDEEFQTPSAEQVSFFTEKVPPGGEEAAPQPSGTTSRGRQYEAFYVDTDNPPLSVTSGVTSNGVPVSVTPRSLDRSKPQKQSFTLHDQAHTVETAIVAGIPVIDGSKSSSWGADSGATPARASRRTSRDKLDQELSKLNADSRNKEIKDGPLDSFFLNPNPTEVHRPDTLNVPKPIQVDGPGNMAAVNGDRPSPKTSFAEIKKQKDSGEVSPVTYLQHRSPLKNPSDKSALKSAFQKVQPGSNPHGLRGQKKTTFAALPNQTTWQESMHKSGGGIGEGRDSNRSTEETDSVQPMATELMSIRMRLEERRRQIETEKHRMEAQWNKQRQRVGKQAFIRVITKGKSADGSSPEDGVEGPPEGATSGVLDSGLGGSQTEGEPEPPTVSDHSSSRDRLREEAKQEAEREQERERQAKEQERERERQKAEQEEKEREEQEHKRQLERELELERERERELERERDKQREKEKALQLEKEKRERLEKEKELERIRVRQKARELELEREQERLRQERAAREEREKRQQREIEKELEAELERERARQREIEKELEREIQMERERTRQAERDMELERLREKQSILEKQLEEKLRERSASPAGMVDSSRPPRPFSRENIQEMIESGKQRWLSREGTPEMQTKDVRPKSYAGGEVDSSQPSNMPSNPMSTSAHATAGAGMGLPVMAALGSKLEYGNSLDRLNTSLSDLQGEIMRLSLEQDQIKNMVVTEPRHHTPTPPMGRIGTTPPKQMTGPSPSRYYNVYPEQSGEPDLAGVVRSTPPGSVSSSTALGESGSMLGHPGHLYGPTQSGQYPPTHPMYGVQQPAPYMATGQYNQPQYMPSQIPYQQPYPQGVPQPQYPHHQGASTPLYNPTPGAPLYQPGYGPPPGHQGQWPSPQHLQPQYATAIVTCSSLGPSHSQHPAQSAYHLAQTHTVSAHQAQHVSPVSASGALASSRGSGGHPDVECQPHPDVPGHYSTLPSSRHSNQSLPGGDEMGLTSPQRPEALPTLNSPHMHSVQSPVGAMHSPAAVSTPTSQYPYHGAVTSPTTCPQSYPTASGRMPSNLPASSEPEPDPNSANNNLGKGVQEGFFIAFDTESPRRQKPKMLKHNKKKLSAGSSDLSPDLPTSEDQVVEHVVASTVQPLSASPPRTVEKAPAVVFTVGEEGVSVEMSELEKKKQRMMIQQMKRREEQEKKRLKQEQERAQKAAIQSERQEPQAARRLGRRQKQEAAENKKAEEKARREAIFNQYLQRKADADNTDEDSKAPPPVKKRERMKPKGQRPKSQPPAPIGGLHSGMGEVDQTSASSHSHSSQEDLCAKGSQGNSGQVTNNNQVDLDYQLTFGGITHRRPPSPAAIVHAGDISWSEQVLGRSFGVSYAPYGARLTGPQEYSDKSGQVQGHGDSASEIGPNSGADYHGPKLFVKPSSKSNRHIIINAISHCCLAGTVNNDIKNKVVEDLAKADAKHFIILFRDAGQQFRSVYTYNPETDEVYKLSGVGPKSLNNKTMERFYKYNSGSKSFAEVTSTKHLSVSIDAVTIQGHLWQKKPPVKKSNAPMY